jgi:hypothetical protein
MSGKRIHTSIPGISVGGATIISQTLSTYLNAITGLVFSVPTIEILHSNS